MAATASRLTTVSRRLTAELGLAGFTIEEVCDEVGVSRRTFFNYFPSKDEAVIGVDEGEQHERLAVSFLSRDSRGWPAVVDDLIDIAIEHVRAAGFGLAEHATLLNAIGREPRLLARFIDISREREQQISVLVAEREGTVADDPRVRASVQIVGTVLRSAGEQMIDPDGDGDFAAALQDSLAALRAVLTPDLQPSDLKDLP